MRLELLFDDDRLWACSWNRAGAWSDTVRDDWDRNFCDRHLGDGVILAQRPSDFCARYALRGSFLFRKIGLMVLMLISPKSLFRRFASACLPSLEQGEGAVGEARVRVEHDDGIDRIDERHPDSEQDLCNTRAQSPQFHSSRARIRAAPSARLQ